MVDDPALEGNPRLIEHDNVVNPLGTLPAREAFSDRPNRKPSGGGPAGAGPVTDDHRERHEAEDERRFAKLTADAAQHFARAQGLTRMVLAAGPRTLGALREAFAASTGNDIERVELPLDLSAKALPQIRDALVQRGLLPAPELPRAGVYRPRGQEPSTR